MRAYKRPLTEPEKKQSSEAYLPDFKYDPTEARFIGNHIDLIVFSVLSKRDPDKVAFIEVKTGNSTLTTQQRRIKKLIQDHKVEWEEIRHRQIEEPLSTDLVNLEQEFDEWHFRSNESNLSPQGGTMVEVMILNNGG